MDDKFDECSMTDCADTTIIPNESSRLCSDYGKFPSSEGGHTISKKPF